MFSEEISPPESAARMVSLPKTSSRIAAGVSPRRSSSFALAAHSDLGDFTEVVDFNHTRVPAVPAKRNLLRAPSTPEHGSGSSSSSHRVLYMRSLLNGWKGKEALKRSTAMPSSSGLSSRYAISVPFQSQIMALRGIVSTPRVGRESITHGHA